MQNVGDCNITSPTFLVLPLLKQNHKLSVNTFLCFCWFCFLYWFKQLFSAFLALERLIVLHTELSCCFHAFSSDTSSSSSEVLYFFYDSKNLSKQSRISGFFCISVLMILFFSFTFYWLQRSPNRNPETHGTIPQRSWTVTFSLVFDITTSQGFVLIRFCVIVTFF